MIKARFLDQCLLIVVVQLFFIYHLTTYSQHAPCYSCEYHKFLQSHPDTIVNQVKSICDKPCECSAELPQCPDGVSIVKDGCGCCPMCARQQGDICNIKDICDVKKGLLCDNKTNDLDNGICRAKKGKPCLASGKLYRDGEEFQLDCRTKCSCQDGNYGCFSLCPQESIKPSPLCESPRLIETPSKCCREWECGPPNWQPKIEMLNDRAVVDSNCKEISTAWTSCSKTCDMGISLRIASVTPNCNVTEESRLCEIRPCDLPPQEHPEHHRYKHRRVCRATIQLKEPRYLIYDNCTSVKKYRHKYCGKCGKKVCCTPKQVINEAIEFECANGNLVVKDFMSIIRCTCHSNC